MYFSFLSSQINRNGLVTQSSHNVRTQIWLPYTRLDVIAVYNLYYEEKYKSGQIFYRLTNNTDILSQATKDVQLFTNNDTFTALNAIVISYIEVTFKDLTKPNTFQLVLATDYINTYGIFNYDHLDENKGTTGYSDTKCSWDLLREYQKVYELSYFSDGDVNGRHVILLTSKECKPRGIAILLKEIYYNSTSARSANKLLSLTST